MLMKGVGQQARGGGKLLLRHCSAPLGNIQIDTRGHKGSDGECVGGNNSDVVSFKAYCGVDQVCRRDEPHPVRLSLFDGDYLVRASCGHGEEEKW